MHNTKNTAQNAPNAELTFEEKIYAAFKWMYGESIAADEWKHEHLFAALLMMEKLEMQTEMLSVILAYLNETGRLELYYATLQQMEKELRNDLRITQGGRYVQAP